MRVYESFLCAIMYNTGSLGRKPIKDLPFFVGFLVRDLAAPGETQTGAEPP